MRVKARRRSDVRDIDREIQKHKQQMYVELFTRGMAR